ncbi:MAG: protein kinase [Zavarzinella sp.]
MTGCWLHPSPPFSWEEVVEMGKQLCGALQHAHEKGIIHRDLKPSNLMLTTEGILKLTDFGIAKDVDVTALTGANNTIGTAAYMSPEQCRGERILTGKSDLYSMGIVMYELLTGRKPFMAESPVEMFMLHVNGQFVRPIKLNPDIPPWLDTLICQLMEKKPDHRPRDADMVAEALDEVLEKAHSQQSISSDKANERGLSSKDSEEDRKAARLLKAGSRKKKLRKKKQPIYQKGWFVIVAGLALLGGIGFIVYQGAIAPPSEEVLLARVAKITDEEAKINAANDYLKYYGKENPDKAAEMQQLIRDVKVGRKERILLNRFGRENLRAKPSEGDDPEAYKKMMIGLAAEEEGDLGLARSTWQSLVDKHSKELLESSSIWGWIAEKKLKDIATTEEQVKTWLKRLERLQLEDKDFAAESELEAMVLYPIRLEKLGDFTMAKQRWSTLRQSSEGDIQTRPWVIYAAARLKELDAKTEPKDTPARVAMIEEKLKLLLPNLTNESAAVRRDTRAVLREIRDMYASETGDLGKQVDAIKAQLAKHPK